jgi:hypothetical protein
MRAQLDHQKVVLFDNLRAHGCGFIMISDENGIRVKFLRFTLLSLCAVFTLAAESSTGSLSSMAGANPSGDRGDAMSTNRAMVAASLIREFPNGEFRFGYPVASAIISWEVDCDRRLARQLEQTFFSERNASGQVMLVERTETPWTPFSQHDEEPSRAFETSCD